MSELVASRAKSVADVAALREQLASLIANPPPADPAPVTAGELAAVPYEQLVAQLSSAIDGAASGIDSLDEQIKTARKAIADGQVQQAETERLAQLQRDIENVRATPLLVSDLATVEVVNAPSTITRSNGERVVTVSVTPKAGDLGGATGEINAAVAAVDLPDGVSLGQGGAAEDQSESFMQLGLAMVIALALVYIVLVATFRSLLQPLLLLVSVPLAATGAIVGLLVTGTPLGIPALIGMLMLIGIVVTNAIVLIDLINEYRREGASIDDSVTHGARLRLRPIIMTACATVFALLPMALGLTGGGAFISKSLAIVVIGGLLSSTVLTLLVVPAIYVLQHRGAERRKARRDQKSERVTTDQIAILAGDATVGDETAGESGHGRLTT
ncbi:efflux RND transporter permease subunit [Agreia pratensis]|nr:efflux RND transporter permease subunit [Agreia pratensis]